MNNVRHYYYKIDPEKRLKSITRYGENEKCGLRLYVKRLLMLMHRLAQNGSDAQNMSAGINARPTA